MRIITLLVFTSLTVALTGLRLRAADAGESVQTAQRDAAYFDRVTNAYAASRDFHERRLREDPSSALDMARLAATLLEEARFRGDTALLTAAEHLARTSLAERRAHNGASVSLLVSVLLAQHRFADAHAVAERLVRDEPLTPEYRAALAEVELELGNYSEAKQLLGTLHAERCSLGIAARFARWQEVAGSPYEAVRVAMTMRDAAGARVDLAPQHLVWFHVRLVDLHLRFGNTGQARQALREVQRLAPNDWRVIAAAARVAAQRRDWKDVRRYAERVVAVVSDPAAMGLLADANRHLGNIQAADAIDATLNGAALRSSAQGHRSSLMRLAESGTSLAEVVERAAMDTVARKDIFGFDLLAWALFRSSRTAEADRVMQRALRTHTGDPLIHFHAGAIAFASGDGKRAHQSLSAALDMRRALADSHIAQARTMLRSTMRGAR